jgi:hypothetical protein
MPQLRIAHNGRRATMRVLAVAALLAGITGHAATAGAETGSITGSMFRDGDRDGVRDPEEGGFASQTLYLLDSAGQWVQSAYTDGEGRYSFSGVTLGDYQVELASASWWAIRDHWVPSTTGSVQPRLNVRVNGASSAPFGWRPIIASTTPGAPISAVTGADGLRIESYNDAVPAAAVDAALRSGALIGAEAAGVIVQFAWGSYSQCSSVIGGGPGSYTSHRATCSISFASWLDGGDRTLFHEYGHAWGNYYGYLMQQDASFTSYIAARGLTGDSRLGTSYGWYTAELLAEDYRHLFGSVNARSGGQLNTAIPLASQVPGLATFLRDTFRGTASGSTTGTGTSGTTPTTGTGTSGTTPTTGTAAVHVGDLDGAASVRKGGWSANATALVRDQSGQARPGATVSLSWRSDRDALPGILTCTTDAAGRCTVRAQVDKRSVSVTFSVSAVATAGYAYTPASNSDPDGDSDGTTLTVRKPA